MESPEAYIAMDRRHALARGESLADRTRGAALFADVSGFTALTETLARELGPHRGAEELTHHLNAVYDALIAELHRYRGSVVGFAGDAITCWIDGDDGIRATACALAMQEAVARIPPVERPGGSTITIGLKVAVAAGPARRFVVGDPEIQLIDVLAGAVVDSLAAAEERSRTGEVVLDEPTAEALADRVELHRRRELGVVERLRAPVEPTPWPPYRELAPEQVRPWLPPDIYERLRAGRGEFLAELRPCTALFLHFGGTDYDADDALDRLDDFVRRAQHVLRRYDANVNQVTIGDKGNYLYAVFGAPYAHEDDPARAVAAALELRGEEVGIGIAQGRMRTGAYGSATRRTYGALGDATNLSARLMQAAAPGQVIATRAVRQAANGFTWETLPDLTVKGKTGHVDVYAPLPPAEAQPPRIDRARSGSPLVGRKTELAQLEERLALALAGEGQVVGVTAEAGVGKSRVVAEFLDTGARELSVHVGECHAYAANSSYLVWQSIWSGLFELADASPEERTVHLAAELEAIEPALLPRLALLGSVVGFPIPDSDLTRTFDAKLRKASLESLLAECLHAKAAAAPRVLVLEDYHWIDALSDDLLEVLARAIARLPVLLVLTYRPPDPRRMRPVRVAPLPYFTEVQLTELGAEESEQLICTRLETLCGPATAPARELVERISTLAQGNPFYIEELVDYMAGQGVDPADQAAVAALELPSSLESLILSRIDRLDEKPKIALRIASIIGRVFASDTLGRVARGFGGKRMVRSSLATLRTLDFVLPEPDPEEVYAFKHVVTQEVAYDSLPYATRALFHRRVGRHLEREAAQVDLLAHHYGLSDDEAKKREYLLKAGEAAQAQYANAAAIDYFRRALPLLAPEEQIPVLLKLGKVLELTGAWDEARTAYDAALAGATEGGDAAAVGRAETAIAELLWKRGDYDEAAVWLVRAQAEFERIVDLEGLGQVRQVAGTIAAYRGDYAVATAEYEASLAIREQLDDRPSMGSLLSNLGIVAEYERRFDRAREFNERALAIRTEIGDRWAITVSLNNLGNVLVLEGDAAGARATLERAVALQREVGDRRMLAISLNSLANVARTQRDLAVAKRLYDESLTISAELDEKWALAYVLEDIAILAVACGENERAVRLVAAARSVRDGIGSPRPPAEQEDLERELETARAALGEREYGRRWAEGLALKLEEAVDAALAAARTAGEMTLVTPGPLR